MKSEVNPKEYLSYNPDSGQLTWLKDRSSNAVAGDIAGYKRKDGYIIISLFGEKYLAHRIAWELFYESKCPEFIDHINGITSDNKITNLRPASHSQNMMNRKMQKNNKSGYTGVRWVEKRGKYQARCNFGHKEKFLGYYESADMAYSAYSRHCKEVYGDFFKDGARTAVQITISGIGESTVIDNDSGDVSDC